MSSVKVAVRVRPFNAREQGSKCCVVMVSEIWTPVLIFLPHLSRMVQLQCLSTLIREMREPSPSITLSGLTTDLEQMRVAFLFQPVQNMPIKT